MGGRQVTLYGIRIEGEPETQGPVTPADVCVRLADYRDEHPEDSEFQLLTVWEMAEDRTIGEQRSVWNFVSRPPAA